MTARELPVPDLPVRSLRGTSPSPLVPSPATPSADVALGPAVETARRELAGFGPGRLLSDVSVARAAGFLVESVREPTRWLRLLLSGLDAFRAAQPDRRLAPLLADAWSSPGRAQQVLDDFAATLNGTPPPELARVGMGPKLWFTANGVLVGWRPLPGGGSQPATPTGLSLSEADRSRAAARALRRAGVDDDELARIRLRDLGRLVPGEVFVPELLADPLVVRLRPARPNPPGTGEPWLAMLCHEARIPVIAAVLSRFGPDAACRHGGELLLPDGVPPD
jgi:hypothetical protein